MLKLVGVLGLALMGAVSHAEIQLHDGLGSLQKLRSFYKGPYSFEQAFVCGDEQIFRANTIRCSYKCGSFCMSTCEEASSKFQKKFVVGVEECSSERVMLYGDNGLQIEVKRSDYEAGGNSLVVPLLKASGFFLSPEADIEVDLIGHERIEIIKNGELISKMGLVLSAQAGVSDKGQGFLMSIVWFPEERGLSALAMFRGDLNDYFLRRNNIRKQTRPF